MITKEEVKAVQEQISPILGRFMNLGSKDRIIGKRQMSVKPVDYSERSFYQAMGRAVALGYKGISTEFTEVNPDFIKDLEDSNFKVYLQDKVCKKVLRVAWEETKWYAKKSS